MAGSIRDLRGAHGSGTDGYGSEPSVPVLKIVEPEPNRECVSRLRSRFQNRRFRFQFRTAGFLRLRLDFTVFRRFLRFRFETAWNRQSRTVSVRNFLNLNRTTVQKLTVSVRVNSHGFGFNRRFDKPWASLRDLPRGGAFYGSRHSISYCYLKKPFFN